jgi:hypothetical protein
VVLAPGTREKKTLRGADQRGLGEHDLRTEKEQQKSVLAPTELENHRAKHSTNEKIKNKVKHPCCC